MHNIIITQNSYLFIHKYFTKIFNKNNNKIIFVKEKERGLSKKYFEILNYFGIINFIKLILMEFINKIFFVFSERNYEYTYINDKKLNQYLEKLLRNNQIDKIISIGCPCKINTHFQEKYNIKILNVHGGILPYQRGRFSPLKSINSGHKYLGATIHIISEKFDSGKILSQSYFKLINKNKLNNYLKVVKLSAQLVESFLKGKKLKIRSDILNSFKR